jgi:hypothetical protein
MIMQAVCLITLSFEKAVDPGGTNGKDKEGFIFTIPIEKTRV